MSTSREKGELVAKVNPGRLGLMIGAALVALASWSYFADSDLKSRNAGRRHVAAGSRRTDFGCSAVSSYRSGCTEAAWNARAFHRLRRPANPPCVSIPFP